MEMASTNGANAMRRLYIENANQRAACRRRSQQFAFLGESETGNGTIVCSNHHFWLLSDLLLQLNEEKNYNQANRTALLAQRGDDRNALHDPNVANAVWVGVRWIDGK